MYAKNHKFLQLNKFYKLNKSFYKFFIFEDKLYFITSY